MKYLRSLKGIDEDILQNAKTPFCVNNFGINVVPGKTLLLSFSKFPRFLTLVPHTIFTHC